VTEFENRYPKEVFPEIATGLPETILVVDDNRQIADFLTDSLLPGLGYHTFWAKDGRTALEKIRKHTISLILLDKQLPDHSGLEILKLLTEEGYRIPTILITAHGSEQVAVDAFRLGVQDYLTKPIDSEELNNAISRALKLSRLTREKDLLNIRLQRQVSWLKALSKVGQSVTSTLELDEVLRRIVEAGVQMTHAEEGFLALLDKSSDQLYLRAVKNIDEEKSKTLRLPVNDSLVGLVLESRLPFRSTSKTQGDTLKVSTGFLVHSLLHVPLISKGNVIGVLSVDNQVNRREFTESDEVILTSLADYATVAIENANLYERAQKEIHDRKRAEIALRASEKRYELAVQGAKDGLWDWDLNSNRVYYSTRWKAMLGYSEGEIGNQPDEWFNRVHPSDLDKLRLQVTAHVDGAYPDFENEHRILHKDGTYRWVLARGLAVKENEGLVFRMAGSLTDVTLRKTQQEKLIHDALHDALTGLPNRALFQDRLRLAIERCKRRVNYSFAVLFLDMDRFKDVNDSLGHLAGDQLLIKIGELIRKGLRATDTIARFGGDEFVVLLDDINDAQAATRVANWIQEELAKSIHVSGQDIAISASIGIVLSTTAYNRPADVLRDADIAMYYAKSKGKKRHQVFEPLMRERLMERLSLESELRLALERDELRVYYQPIISLQFNQLIGFEALARWQHPSRGLLFPRDFLPIAEESGLIIPIDRWVLREATRQMREWQTKVPKMPKLRISINISSRHITQPDLIDHVRQALSESGLDPRNLKLEISEHTMMDRDKEIDDLFAGLQSLGIQIQIDDFGIGFSSLSYLSNYPINALKIDQNFVRKMAKDESQKKIVKAIIELTHRLGVDVIAEGVETNKQLEQLKQLECEYGQGYLISKPLDKDEVQALLFELYSAEVLSALHKSEV
jgi:diguanylate cyclase (GGDEF)-like protein/PAS domain S-box-containing protein